MNQQSNAVRESFISRESATAPVSTAQLMYWSILRELWENRSIYLAPLAAAGIFLFGFLINMLGLRRDFRDGLRGLDPSQLRLELNTRYELSAALIMGTALIVGIVYSLDALYGERRDRSILFWKSMPVSDVMTVLSKLAIPLAILPLLSFVVTVGTQFLMILLSTAIFSGSGVNIAALWTDASFLQVSLVMLYHIVTVHGLWYAPLYGWLLLVSAWAPRAPYMWAFLPPFVICGVEKIAFNTSYSLSWLEYRLLGPGSAMAPDHAHSGFMATLIPQHFFSTPGLWTGLAIAAVFLTATIRLRHYQGPI
jgi:ABC-2 type transport system permease protein